MVMTASATSVLVICTGNICRSPMATGILQHMLPAGLQPVMRVASAGTHALHGHPAEPYAVQATQALGIDIARHRARQLDRKMALAAGDIVVMEAAHARIIHHMAPAARQKVHLLGAFHPARNPFDIPDPYGGSLSDFMNSAHIIQVCVAGLVGYLEDRYMPTTP
jgi:protein-tyrosine phosphatase